MKWRFVVLGMIVGLLTACPLTKDVNVGLPETSDDFCESMRWSDFQGAAIYMVPDQRDLFLEQFKEDEDLHIVSSRILKADLGEDGDSAAVEYQMTYYRLPSNRIKKWRWTQRWILTQEKKSKTGGWMIDNAPPKLPWNE